MQSAAAGDGHATPIGPQAAVDVNPDPRIVEVHLTAEQRDVDLGTGGLVKMFTYNGTTPGPTIEANVGDTLIVRFENRLPVTTTIHWHGVPVPALMDGTHLSQQPVPPGGTFRYEFRLPDAATYWYHPHIRTNEQIELGLYGALIVRDPAEVADLGLPETEHVLLLDDILLDEEGQVAPPYPADPLENATLQANGREGNWLLVNGRVAPEFRVERGVPQRLRLINAANSRFMRVSIPGHSLYRIASDGGLLEQAVEVAPIGMVGAQLASHHGADQASHHGSDQDAHHGSPQGALMMSDPDRGKGLLLTPGDRIDVVFTPTGDESVALEWHDTARGRHTAAYQPDGGIGFGHAPDDGMAPMQVMMRMSPVGSQPGAHHGAHHGHHGAHGASMPDRLATIDPIDVTDAPTIKVELGHTLPDADGNVVFFVQRKANTGQCALPADTPCPLPFSEITPEDAPSVMVGETRIIEVVNLTGGDHNFHLHGFFFQPIDVQYVDLDNPANNRVVPFEERTWEDTILIPAGTGPMMRSQTVTRVAVLFDDPDRAGQLAASGGKAGPGTAGGWFFHCHLLDHAARGMMSYIQVVEADKAALAD